MADAVVLIGAVAKGAFTAGALAVLSDPAVRARLGLDVRRIVGASSGALNAVFYANAIRTDTEAGAGLRLIELWREHATVQGAVDINLHDIVSERGISDVGKLLALLRSEVPPSPTLREIEMRLVVTNADGETVEMDGATGTTFEHVVDITADDFTTKASVERVYAAAAASAALPVLYAPVLVRVGAREIQGLDGSLLNRHPLGLALEGAPAVSRVFVIVPLAKVRQEPADMRGRTMVSHVFDMLVHERLLRDTLAVLRVNRALERLERVLPDATLRAAVLEACEWAGRRRVQIIEIRPDAELPGDAFSGFWSRELREGYVRAGVDAARRALG